MSAAVVQSPPRRWRRIAPFSIALAALVVIAFVSIGVGRYPLSPGEVLGVLWSGLHDATEGTAGAIVWQIRLPRIGVAALVGAALSVAGAAFQHLFRNPLVAPDTLGVSAGAALGAVLAIVFGARLVAIEAAAFAGGLGAVGIVMLVAHRLPARDPLVTLILTGVVVASLLGAGISLAKTIADPYNELPAITFWLMGSFASSTYRELVAIVIPVVLACGALLALAWRIDLLALAEDEARALGVGTTALRLVVIASATLATAAAVAVSGIIGWVGLIVPHMARLIVGPAFARLLPLAAVLGAGLMLAIDSVARASLAVEVPPGILTAVIGTPAFIALLARARRDLF